MMRFKAFQFATLGSAPAGMQNADREAYTLELENHARELQVYAEALYGEYEQLRSAHGELEQHAASVESERDELQGQVKQLTESLAEIETQARGVATQFQSVKENAAEWVHENARRLEAYEVIKKILGELVDNANEVFTDAISVEQRENISRLLHQLP